MNTRRQFLGTVGAGATAVALRPLFSRSYVFGAARAGMDGVVHINYNENPYGPSEKTMKAIRDAVLTSGRYYSDFYYEDLRAALAKQHGLTADNILMGAGSTEILKLCDDVYLGEKRRLVVAEPAYDAVIQYAVNSKADAAKIPLTKDYRHDLVKMAEATTPQTGMAYICNPNNPTGTIVLKDDLQRFMDRIPESVPVVVDEAYSHFAGPDFASAIKYAKEGRNVIVAKTFSKAYGLAGMRIGYAVAKKDLIDKMKPFGVDFAVSALSAAAATAALTDQAHIDRVVKLNEAQRQALYAEMKSMKFEAIPSHTNFVMIHIKTPVAPVITEFAKRKILVGREFPPMVNYLRVSIGTEDEMKKFFVAFREIFRS